MSISDTTENAILNLIFSATAWANYADNAAGLSITPRLLYQKIDVDGFNRVDVFNILANPNIAYIFLILGFYGLLYEITHPGMGAPGAIGGTFNVCSGRAHTLAEVIELAERASGHRMEVRVNKAFVRANEVKTLCGSRARLESVIGAVKMPELAETLTWMLDA